MSKMCKRILTLAFTVVLAASSSLLLSGAAQAGPSTVCGDSAIDPPEECDDGNTTTGDGCSFPSCLPEVCGDTIVNPDPPSSETCDDGNSVAGDGCSATCQLECGNGTLEGAEECDTSGQSATCDDDCTLPVCGDGNLNEDASEACDDGNTVDDDQCSNACQANTVAQEKKQQGCVNAVNKNLAGVSKARGADNAACVKSVAAGKATFAACFGTDVKGKVGKSQTKTTNTVGKKCNDTDETPSFAFTDAATVNTAADQESEDAFVKVFGATPVIAAKASAKEDAACQASALSLLNKHADVVAKEANKAKKTALKGSKTTAAVANAADLAAAIDAALAASTKVASSAGKIPTKLAKKCADAQVDANFDCTGAVSLAALATCVEDAAFAAACEALEAGDALDLDCDTL